MYPDLRVQGGFWKLLLLLGCKNKKEPKMLPNDDIETGDVWKYTRVGTVALHHG